ncbi:uncharacterized protein LOC105442794 [Strongylocentrotus purpuratus]|uniref:Uncharacterized protein n=1 Tax=Strongylocentrotus purpuratus TaxID=7668 RepID=A0A7M7PCM0_STRPU|nr:uncharacterized protein LOC105442794 [Strongylocentrotus purpuratus]
MSHFSGGYFALIWDWLFLKGILLSCMSFLPRVLPSPRKPVLEVRFVKMPHDQKWQDVHALKKSGSQPVKDDDDIVVFCRSTLTVSCQLGANSPETDAIQHSNLSLKPKETVYFTLDLTDESDETLVTLNLVQTTTQKIKFNTRFQGIDDRFTEQDTPTPSTFET